jgi:hypothetical protein
MTGSLALKESLMLKVVQKVPFAEAQSEGQSLYQSRPSPDRRLPLTLQTLLALLSLLLSFQAPSLLQLTC